MLSEDEIRHIRDSTRFLHNLGFGDFTCELIVLDTILDEREKEEIEAWLHVE